MDVMEVILQLLILGYYPIVFQMIPVLIILLKMNNVYQSMFVVTVNLVGSVLQYKSILKYVVNWIHLHVHVHVDLHVHVGDVFCSKVCLFDLSFSTITLPFLFI